MATGKVKTLKESFGFISRDGEPKDLFFHTKDMVDTRFEDLKLGDMVTFEVIQTDRGAAAAKVSLAPAA